MKVKIKITHMHRHKKEIWNCKPEKTKRRQLKSKHITGLRVGGESMCNRNEIESSTKDLIDKCLEINGGTVLYQDLKLSTFSINIVRYLNL